VFVAHTASEKVVGFGASLDVGGQTAAAGFFVANAPLVDFHRPRLRSSAETFLGRTDASSVVFIVLCAALN
jgi:hypothetical protein